jgi:hypothetical protein
MGTGTGINCFSENNIGIIGTSDYNIGVQGSTVGGTGIKGIAEGGIGVVATATDGGLGLQINANNVSDIATFNSDSVEVARISQDGYLGIGTTTPSKGIDVSGSGIRSLVEDGSTSTSAVYAFNLKSPDGSTALNANATNNTAIYAQTTTGTAIQAVGPVQITGSLVASGSSHTITATSINTLTAPTTNITSNTYTRIGGAAGSETTRLTVQPAAKKVYTYYSGSYNGSLGLNVDFGNNLYQLGDFGKIKNSNYISVDDSVVGSVVSIPSSSLQVGLGVTITGSLNVSGSTHTLTSTTTNINSTTTNLTSTALYLNSNHITASGQTSGDIDLTIAPGGAGSAIINLKANTGGTSILNATGNNNTLSIKTNSIERINIDGNGTTAITGSLSVTGSNTLIGTKTITGSVFISGSKTIIGTNTITGSLNVSGSVTVKGTVSASSFTGSLFGTASYALTASYVLGGGAAAFPYDGSTTPAVITGSLIVSGSGVTVTGSLNVSGSVTVKGTVSASSFTGSLFGTASYALSASSPYKVYTAILNQSSLQPPNPTVLQNTLGGNVT